MNKFTVFRKELMTVYDEHGGLEGLKVFIWAHESDEGVSLGVELLVGSSMESRGAVIFHVDFKELMGG